MKQIIMAAEVSGQSKYAMTCVLDPAMQWHAHPELIADRWVSTFIHNLRMSKEFVQERVTFTMLTHEGATTHRMISIFAAQSAEDLAKFWIPVVTKYISEN